MNVANLTPAVGSAGSVTATPVANAEGTGLGQLFSMQLMQVMDQVGNAEETTVASEGLSEEDMQALADLMALLAQLLGSGQATQDELPTDAQQKFADAVDQLLGKALGDAGQVSEDLKQILANLKKGEATSDELNKLAALLESLKNQKGNADESKRSALNLRSDVLGNMNTTQQDTFKTISSLRLNQGLSAYKLEAGIQSQTVQPTLQAGLLNQEGDAQEGQLNGNGQTPIIATPNTQTQSVQTFSQQSVPTHHVNANQLTQQVTQLFVSKMQLTQNNGIHEARLILNPQALGQVDVTITSQNGVITAQFHAETQAGKEMLDNQLPQLRAALAQQGLQVDRLEVNQQQDTTFNFQQQREQARQQQENRQQQDKDEQEFALDALVDSNESTEVLWNRLRETARGIDDIV
ncbi:flagellar hook-length control protein FliK [Brevibacillus brevis]|uniref:flagellar hook-length control protein FliK n=1 Tax=Brevibacillus brevis TaxID=1393 RepID=UPI0025A67D87|nr:flagellar hook-length control protein FliK [Brevibacillus brevis]WJQ79389.1 flagellar hook-length control protein FliK [Brevibacillus brevis]